MFEFNRHALAICNRALRRRGRLGIHSTMLPNGATIVDFGIENRGGLEAGVALTEICLGGLGHVRLARADAALGGGPAIEVFTDHPAAACLGSQYGGWALDVDGYRALGSGPMRAARGAERVITELGLATVESHVIGVIEADQPGPPSVVEHIASECRVEPFHLTLCIAPTTSIAGAVQIAGRAIESALHKLHELAFDVRQVRSGWGIAPLANPGGSQAAAMGRVNDAILLAGQVVLYVDADDDALRAIGPRVPSNSSPQFGRPFAQIFADCGGDFYQIDPMLFGPAEVVLVSLQSGRRWEFGRIHAELWRAAASA